MECHIFYNISVKSDLTACSDPEILISDEMPYLVLRQYNDYYIKDNSGKKIQLIQERLCGFK